MGININIEIELTDVQKRWVRRSAGASAVIALLGLGIAAAAPIDTSWIAANQPVSSAKLKENLDNLQTQVTALGAIRTEFAKATAACSAEGTCVLTGKSSGVTSVTRGTQAGAYTINFVAGTYSAAPTCSVLCGSGGGIGCRTYALETATTYQFQGMNAAGADTDVFFDIICVGRP